MSGGDGQSSLPPAPTPPNGSAAGGGVPTWLDPNKVPPWAYILLLLGGGGTLSGVTVFSNESRASIEDIERIEEKANRIDAKVDALDEKLTDLRIAIARYHAASQGPK